MNRLIGLLTTTLVACSGASSTDSGVDSGSNGIDAGPTCTGVPARLTQFTCVERTVAAPCETTLAATVSRHFANCDAGLGIVGHLSLGECADLDSVRWTYGFPGDTYECFYARDGGAWVGAINFSDHGVLAGGHVGDCASREPAMCRDGG